MDNKGKFQLSGIKWLYEMELVDDPQLINNLKLNIFSISNLIKEVEFLSSVQHRQMLVYIELNWFGRKLFRNLITTSVLDRVQTLLPRFQIRVVTDRAILDLSIAKVKAALTGGKSREKSAVSTDVSSSDSKPSDGGV